MQITNGEDLHQIVLNAPIGICILDAATLVGEVVNDKFLEVAGKPYEAIAGKFYWDAFAEARPYYEAALAGVVKNGVPYYANEVELMLIRQGKEERVFVTFVYSPIKNDDGKVAKVAVWVLENTMQVAARQKTEQNAQELQAINEEMTATNEELAAVNEELSSTNEELSETQASLKQMNTELAESSFRLKMAVEATALGTWDYSPLTGVLYWSEECKNIFGFPLESPLSFEAYSSHIHPDDLTRMRQEIQQSIAEDSDSRYDVTYRIIRFDNLKVRWVRERGTGYFNQRGEITRLIGTMLDITDSVLANERIAASEKLFRSIAVNIPNSLIIVIDKEHRFVFVEGDLMEKMGYDQRDYEGKHPTEIGQTERYEASKHLYDRMFAGERISVERRGAAGEYFIVHLIPLKNDHDEVESGLIIALDITDIIQAEEKSAKLAAIVESSDDAIISKTLESVITSWNDSAQRMFGYAADEIIGETIYKLIPPDRQEEEPRILSRLKSGERVEHFETKRVTKNGELIDVSLTISPVKDKHGNIIGLSKIARDITEKKLDEVRKNDFIGMVSHELKTPLTSLNAIIQVANARLKNSEDPFLRGAMEKANIQVKRMTAMINGFLNISRLEAGKMLINKELFALDQLMLELLDETKFIVNTHPIILAAAGPIQVVADREKISSVLSNLISNAVKYSPGGKPIEINCQARGKMVVVSVKDEGMGIKPDDLDQIFDRYYRVETNHTRHISGFGIGLYLSAEIVKRHDGEIWAESESGKGSTFYFSIPLAS